MRIGQNPAKAIDHVPQPARVTLAVVVYIPFLSGYYEQSLDVLKACLGSLVQNTPRPYDLLVFDNASCPEVRSYLSEKQAQGEIQYLVLSEKNVGKGGAWNLIFQGAPGEVIAYTDSDVYFQPGWLENSLELLDGFPNVGMVTARPLRTPEAYFSSTLEWARQESQAVLESGDFIPWDMTKEHTDSLGVSVEKSQEWYRSTMDWKISYNDLAAYAGAAHFQFIARKQEIQQLFPIQMDRPMGQVRSLDENLNAGGYLRLTTVEPYVRHMGNRLSVTSTTGQKQSIKNTSRILDRLLNLPPVRQVLLGLYNLIFRIYYSDRG